MWSSPQKDKSKRNKKSEEKAEPLSETDTRHLEQRSEIGRLITAQLVVRHKFSFTFLVALIVLFSGAAAWVERMDQDRRLNIQTSTDLQDLRMAVMQSRLAGSLHVLGDYGRAEQEYRQALVTFERLERQDARFAGRAVLGLATLLLTRPERSNADYLEAETLLLEALGLFDKNPETCPSGHLPS